MKRCGTRTAPRASCVGLGFRGGSFARYVSFVFCVFMAPALSRPAPSSAPRAQRRWSTPTLTATAGKTNETAGSLVGSPLDAPTTSTEACEQ